MALRVETSHLQGPGLVAVSGGADSVALCIALQNAGCQFTIAHLNHQLRDDASDSDEQFVIDLAAKLGLPCKTMRIDIRATGGNMEAMARERRYAWFAELAKDLNLNWIATGHTANDQAETVLHRLIRGTGLQGLRGIAPVRRDSVVPIVRPLLSVNRIEIEDYLNELKQPYCTDATNADTAFTRNRIRHELLPMLSSFNSRIVEVLGQLARQAEESFAEREAECKIWLKDIELPRAGDVLVFKLSSLLKHNPSNLREIFRHVWQRERWPMDRMAFDHWQRLVEAIQNTTQSLDFPNGVRMRFKNEIVTLQRL